MCFTIEVHLTRKAIEKRFSVDTSALYDFDFNYFYRAFSNPLIPVIARRHPDESPADAVGIDPSWARDREKAERDQERAPTMPGQNHFMKNHPSEKPLQKGRCLVLAHGFFEWQHVNGAKIPWYIRLEE